MITSEDPIDVVYLRCDGSDPAFAAKKKQLLAKMGLPWDESNFGELRYIDNNELKYSLRSVDRYIPWINHIYVVTDTQRPSWLCENDKLTVVDQTF